MSTSMWSPTVTAPVRLSVARRGVPLLVLALVLVFLAGPATAARARFTDPNDHRGFDVRVVKVHYGDALRVRLVHDGKVAVGQKYKFWIDTTSKDAGPEYSFAFTPNSDFLRLRKVDDFSGSGSRVSGCDHGWAASANIFRPHRDVWGSIAGRCLGAPSHVRVSVQLIVSGRDDWAPRFHRFYPWVERY